MKFQREIATSRLFEELAHLFEKHYLEISANLDIKLELHVERYLLIENAGGLRMFIARNENDEAIGYAWFFVSHNLHYRESLQAVQDVIYLDRSYRGTGLGKEFIQWCDDQLKTEGCQLVYHHIKARHNFGPMLESIGYKLVDLIYSKRLD